MAPQPSRSWRRLIQTVRSPGPLGRDVVMEQALSDVQQSTVTDTEPGCLGSSASKLRGAGL